jgi:hypothetical protein
MKTLNRLNGFLFYCATSTSTQNDDIAHMEEVIDTKNCSIWLIMRFSLNHRDGGFVIMWALGIQTISVTFLNDNA